MSLPILIGFFFLENEERIFLTRKMFLKSVLRPAFCDICLYLQQTVHVTCYNTVTHKEYRLILFTEFSHMHAFSRLPLKCP